MMEQSTVGTAGAGLVGQVTSGVRPSQRVMPTLSIKGALKELNNRRRTRRMRRVVIASADASRDVFNVGGGRYDAVFVTLTYRQEEFYTTRDISGYIKATREWLKRQRVRASYQWVIELTRKGKPHYHILWWVPKGIRLPKPDASGMWQKGLSRIEKATRPVGYLVKYATKGDSGEFPKGARLFGVGTQEEGVKLARHRHGLPMWLYERTDSDCRCVRVARVGWVEKATGVIHDTPFTFEIGKDDWGFVVVKINPKEVSSAH